MNAVRSLSSSSGVVAANNKQSSKQIVLFGSNGDIGKRVLLGLLESDYNHYNVKAVVRSKSKLNDVVVLGEKKKQWGGGNIKTSNLKVVEGSILNMDDKTLANILGQCDTVICCLGFGTILWGEPSRLKYNATMRITSHLRYDQKFICLTGAAARHPNARSEMDIIRKNNGIISCWLERMLHWLVLRWFQPVNDMEETLSYLNACSFTSGGTFNNWVSVRPGMFVDGSPSKYSVTEYRTVGLLSGRVTTKENISRFIIQLVEDDNIWSLWKNKMPVIIDDA